MTAMVVCAMTLLVAALPASCALVEDPVVKPHPALPAGVLPYRPYILSPQTTGYLSEDVWPTIFFGEDAVAEIRRKVEKLPWAQHAVALMRQEAELVLAAPPPLPVEQAGWRHDFYARATGEHLRYDPADPTRFLDPGTGTYEYDAAQRKAWVLLTHERTYRLMRSLGVLYRLTGDERYAHWVAQGMRQAAEYYTHAEFRRHDVGGPALYYCNLYDAAMLMLLCNAYSLTRASAAYTAEDHQHIRTQIVEERMPSMIAFLHKRPTHNMSCFVSGALAYAGQLFDKPEWVQLALGENSGLRTQLMTGLRTGGTGEIDGLWYEGTMFYHFYSLCPLISLWEIERQRKGALVQDPDLQRRFAAMFAAPVAIVDPQLRLPLVGDLGAPRSMNLAGYRHVYEYAAGQLDPPRYGPVLAAIYAQSGAPRTDLTALAYGPDTLPEPGGIPTGHTLLPVARMGVFRAATPERLYLTFRAGKYVGGHDHPDRLTIALNAFGMPISPDLGEPGYSLRDKANSSYYRTTISHNTLFADEAEQVGEASLEWVPDAVPARARGAITDTQGIRYRRTIFFDAPYVVLLDEYAAEAAHRFGWSYHAYGKVSVANVPLHAPAAPALGMPPLPTDKGYAFLTERRSGVSDGMLEATWAVTEAVTLRLRTVSDGPFEVHTAVSPGHPYPDHLGAVLLRAPGTARRFASVLEPCTGPATVTGIALDGDTIMLTLADGTTKRYRWE